MSYANPLYLSKLLYFTNVRLILSKNQNKWYRPLNILFTCYTNLSRLLQAIIKIVVVIHFTIVIARQEDDYILTDCEIGMQRVYLLLLATTDCCWINPQHLRSHRESTHGQRPSQFFVAIVKTFQNSCKIQRLYKGLQIFLILWLL